MPGDGRIFDTQRGRRGFGDAGAGSKCLCSDDWIDALRSPGPTADVQRQATGPDNRGVSARLDSLDAAVALLREEFRATIHVPEDPLAAIAEAAGDPRTYDAPDSRRVGVFVRLLPELRRAVADVKARRGLRSDAGAWEYVVRLGIAAEGHGGPTTSGGGLRTRSTVGTQ